MPSQFLAWLMTTFAFAMPFIFGQPTNKPETRTSPYGKEMPPDKYGVWPTEEFETGQAPLWLQTWALRPTHIMRNLFSGSKNEGIVALYKGKIVYEWYADGWDKDTRHTLNSATKSVTQALVGIAIAEGFIDSVDDKFVKYYPDANIEVAAEWKKEITIEQLLTMTSGVAGDNDGWLEDYAVRLSSQAQWMAFWRRFDRDSARATFEVCSMVVKPGSRWNYSSLGTGLLLGLVARVIDQPLEDYVNEKLFGPMGITNFKWGVQQDGSYAGESGLYMTPRDMVKFGYLYLNYGRWEDQQLVPADWVAQSPPTSKSPFGYGRLFWNARNAPFSGGYEASGAQGQVIQIIPPRDLVIVRTGAPR